MKPVAQHTQHPAVQQMAHHHRHQHLATLRRSPPVLTLFLDYLMPNNPGNGLGMYTESKKTDEPGGAQNGNPAEGKERT